MEEAGCRPLTPDDQGSRSLVLQGDTFRLLPPGHFPLIDQKAIQGVPGVVFLIRWQSVCHPGIQRQNPTRRTPNP